VADSLEIVLRKMSVEEPHFYGIMAAKYEARQGGIGLMT